MMMPRLKSHTRLFIIYLAIKILINVSSSIHMYNNTYIHYIKFISNDSPSFIRSCSLVMFEIFVWLEGEGSRNVVCWIFQTLIWLRFWSSRTRIPQSKIYSPRKHMASKNPTIHNQDYYRANFVPLGVKTGKEIVPVVNFRFFDTVCYPDSFYIQMFVLILKLFI